MVGGVSPCEEWFAPLSTRGKLIMDSFVVPVALAVPFTGSIRSSIAPGNILRVAEVLLVCCVGAVLYQLVHDAWLPPVQEISMEAVAHIVHKGVHQLVPCLEWYMLGQVVGFHEDSGHHDWVRVGAFPALPAPSNPV